MFSELWSLLAPLSWSWAVTHNRRGNPIAVQWVVPATSSIVCPQWRRRWWLIPATTNVGRSAPRPGHRRVVNACCQRLRWKKTVGSRSLVAGLPTTNRPYNVRYHLMALSVRCNQSRLLKGLFPQQRRQHVVLREFA